MTILFCNLEFQTRRSYRMNFIQTNHKRLRNLILMQDSFRFPQRKLAVISFPGEYSLIQCLFIVSRQDNK